MNVKMKFHKIFKFRDIEARFAPALEVIYEDKRISKILHEISITPNICAESKR